MTASTSFTGRSFALVCCLAALLLGPAPARGQDAKEPGEKGPDKKADARSEAAKLDPQEINRKVDAFLGATDALARARTRRALIELGAGALDAVRARVDEQKDAARRAALEAIAVQLLAAKFADVILQRQETGLVFDGQYDDFGKEGPLAPRALDLLVDDETTAAAVRLGAVNALADVAGASFLPRIRELEDDPLLPAVLRDELGTLIAILGDTSQLDGKLRKLERDSRSRSTERSLGAFVELANLYYKIRRYDDAIKCYERILEIFTQARENLSKLPREHPLHAAFEARFGDRAFALHYYNAACSYSLAGKIEESRAHMKKAVKLDPIHFDNMSLDGDLKNLRESEGYGEFKKELAKMLQAESI